MVEKLTNGVAVTVRFTTAGFAELHALAESEGMEHSEYIRHLVDLDKVAKKRKWVALSSVFSKMEIPTTISADDEVGRDE